MDKWQGKVAIVTGAGSGIGAAIATALVHNGLNVVGFDLKDTAIKSLACELSKGGEPGKLHGVKVDLRKEADILDAFAWVEEKFGGADILVNNAGVLFVDKFVDGKTEEWRASLEVNVLAPSLCTRQYLQSMERRNNQMGHIFFTNSIVGITADVLGHVMYTASKHALRAISMILRRELAEKDSTIRVTSISPGPVETNVARHSDFQKVFDAMPKMNASEVATIVVQALSSNTLTQVCEVVLNPLPAKHSLF